MKECPHRDNIPQSLLLPVGICTHSFGDRHPQFRLTSVHHNLEYPENILNHRVDSSLVFLTIIVFVVILSTCADLMPLPLGRWLVRSRSTQVLVILLVDCESFARRTFTTLKIWTFTTPNSDIYHPQSQTFPTPQKKHLPGGQLPPPFFLSFFGAFFLAFSTYSS